MAGGEVTILACKIPQDHVERVDLLKSDLNWIVDLSDRWRDFNFCDPVVVAAVVVVVAMGGSGGGFKPLSLPTVAVAVVGGADGESAIRGIIFSVSAAINQRRAGRWVLSLHVGDVM
jgi:hypothetical protein